MYKKRTLFFKFHFLLDTRLKQYTIHLITYYQLVILPRQILRLLEMGFIYCVDLILDLNLLHTFARN